MAVYQSLSVTQVSQNQQENTSQVRILWQSTQTGSSYNDTQHTANYTISINDTPPTIYEVSYTLPLQSTATILDITLTVPHDSKGQTSVTVTTWMNTNISAGVVELSQRLVPDTIPQAGTLRATDAVVDGVSKLAITRKSSSHTYSIGYSFGSLSGYLKANGQAQQQETKFASDSVDFTIPSSFYGQIPNAKSGTCTLTLRTYLGSTLVGQPQSTAFTVTASEAACRPAVTGQVTDTNSKTLALTGNSRVFVANASTVQCTITATAKNSASIKRKNIAGQTVSGSTLTLAVPQTGKIVFAAEDSRGYSTQQTVQLTTIAYEKPACEAQVTRTDMASGKAVLSVSGTCFWGSFGAASNTLSAAYSTDGVNFTAVSSVTVSAGRFSFSVNLSDMSYTSVYTVTVRVADKLFTVEKKAVLKKSVPVFDWGEANFAFHVPVTLSTPLSIASGGTGKSIWSGNGVVIKDSTSLNSITPTAGAFYSTGSTPKFGVLPIAQGGTGGTSAQAARQNLGMILPMTAGEEYATDQRWLGQTVYTKIINFGNLPNNAAKGVAHGAAASRVLGCWGTQSNGRCLPWGGIHYYRADLFCDTEKVYIDTEYDYSDQTAVVQLWYIK